MKTRYRLSTASKFPAYHERAGEETNFKHKIGLGVDPSLTKSFQPKIHTIRQNYHLWEKRFQKINKDIACLELFEWEGKPYKSKQATLYRLNKDDGIGLQKCYIELTEDTHEMIVTIMKGNKKKCDIHQDVLAINDGLTVQDMIKWFKLKPGQKTGALALIHFTNFRY